MLGRSLPTQTFTVFRSGDHVVVGHGDAIAADDEARAPRRALDLALRWIPAHTCGFDLHDRVGKRSSDWTNKPSDVVEDDARCALDGPGETDAEDDAPGALDRPGETDGEDEALGALDGPGEADGEDDDPHAAATSATARVVAMIVRCRMTFTPSASDDRPESLEDSGTLHGGVKSSNACCRWSVNLSVLTRAALGVAAQGALPRGGSGRARPRQPRAEWLLRIDETTRERVRQFLKARLFRPAPRRPPSGPGAWRLTPPAYSRRRRPGLGA